MTFLNPFVLFGLIAAGVPVLIHLLQLKKLRQIEFSSIKFLKEIQHASARRVKLRDFLLLLLRSLAIASLVFGFARPVLKGIGGNDSKTSSVVIIDDSPSTTARNEYGEIFSQLKSTTLNLISRLNIGDNVDLILASQVGQIKYGDTSQVFPITNPQFLLPLVSRIDPSNVRVAYSSAIGAAANRLQSSNYVNKEIYLLGDLQRTAFTAKNELEDIRGGSYVATRALADVRLFFLQTNEALDNNLSISNVKFSDEVVEVNSPLGVQATVVNNSRSEKNGVVVSLFLDGRKVAQSVADLPAGGSRVVNLAFNELDGGFHKGVVGIDDNSIQTDNKFFFSFFAIKELSVAIVTSKQEDDFVLRALNAIMDTSTSIATNVVTPDQFTYMDLSKTDVAVVEEYSPNQRFEAKLNHFLRNGGGIILFAPSSSQVSSFDGLLRTVDVGRTVSSFSSGGGNFLSIERIDAGDEFFSGMFSSKQSAEQVKNQLVTTISNMVQIEPNPLVHILMSTSSGPFLMCREVGSGFVFVFASQADSSSSNFSMSPFFPVAVQRALFYSAAVKHKPIQVFAGEGADYTYSLGGIKSATLIGPDGSKSKVVPRYVGGAAKFSLRSLNELGTYSLTDGSIFCEISVNIDPRESDLSKASRAEVVEYSKNLGFSEKNVFLLFADKSATAAIDKLRRGQDLSSFFAGVALLCLVLEIFVSKMRTF